MKKYILTANQIINSTNGEDTASVDWYIGKGKEGNVFLTDKFKSAIHFSSKENAGAFKDMRNGEIPTFVKSITMNALRSLDKMEIASFTVEIESEEEVVAEVAE